MARKAKARKCTDEIVGNIQAKLERRHRLVNSFSVIPPARSSPQRCKKMESMKENENKLCKARTITNCAKGKDE
jgi:hypothetical protein